MPRERFETIDRKPCPPVRSDAVLLRRFNRHAQGKRPISGLERIGNHSEIAFADSISWVSRIYDPKSVRILTSCAISTGLTRCPSQPASLDCARSDSWPQPVRAMIFVFSLQG